MRGQSQQARTTGSDLHGQEPSVSTAGALPEKKGPSTGSRLFTQQGLPIHQTRSHVQGPCVAWGTLPCLTALLRRPDFQMPRAEEPRAALFSGAVTELELWLMVWGQRESGRILALRG